MDFRSFRGAFSGILITVPMTAAMLWVRRRTLATDERENIRTLATHVVYGAASGWIFERFFAQHRPASLIDGLAFGASVLTMGLASRTLAGDFDPSLRRESNLLRVGSHLSWGLFLALSTRARWEVRP